MALLVIVVFFAGVAKRPRAKGSVFLQLRMVQTAFV
jgi:hypothetical protein